MTNNNNSESVKKRGEYSTKRKKELESLLSAVKEFKVSQKTTQIFKKNPATIAEFTKDTCLYPSRYLNNDNSCVSCDIYEHCACGLKNLGKKKRNE